MYRLLKILILVLLIILLITILSLARLLLLSKKSMQSSTEPITTETPLYPVLNWSETGTNETFSITNILQSSAIYTSDGEIIDVKPTGKEWMANKSNLSSIESTKLYQDLSKYYESQLENDGWKDKVQYNDLELQTIQADGPTGNTWGYLKLIQGNMKVFIISQHINFINESTDIPECPCDVEFRVFVSDLISVENLKINQ